MGDNVLFVASDPIKEWLLTAHPNPQRIACFPSEVLRDLANKRLPADHPAFDHLDVCSPCYKEFSFFLQARQLADRDKNKRFIKISGIAALIVVSVGSWIGIRQYSSVLSTKRVQPAPLGVINFSTASTRGQGQVEKDQIIPRTVRALAIIVPFRDEPGVYDVELRRASDDQVVLRFTGTVSQDNRSGFRTLRGAVDFAKLTPGWYQVLWYRQGSTEAEVGEFRIQ